MLNNTKRRGTRIPHTRATPHSRVSAELLNTVCYIKFSFRHSQRRTYNITKPNASERDKLADLLVMDLNPLDNIRNTESIKYTMINGRLFDAETMNEIGNYNTPRTKFFWELNRSSEAFKYHEETNGFQGGHIDD